MLRGVRGFDEVCVPIKGLAWSQHILYTFRTLSVARPNRILAFMRERIHTNPSTDVDVFDHVACIFIIQIFLIDIHLVLPSTVPRIAMGRRINLSIK